METRWEIAAFDRGIHSVMQLVLPETAEGLIGFRPDPELQTRIDELAERSTESRLREAEKSEHAGDGRANKFVAILQRQARRLIADQAEEKEASIRARVRKRAGKRLRVLTAAPGRFATGGSSHRAHHSRDKWLKPTTSIT